MFLVFQSALSRGCRVYRENISETEKIEFKKSIAEKLREIRRRAEYQRTGYLTPKDGEERHFLSNLDELQCYINSTWEHILYPHDGEQGWLTFGRTQKILNLYLKYCWVLDCLDLVKVEPPHCPIDSNVLRFIGWKEKYPKWTCPKFKEGEYKRAIELCREKAKNEKLRIAEWELRTFNNRNI